MSRRYPLTVGLTVTPTRLVHHAGGTSTSVAWDDVLGVSDADPDVIVTARNPSAADVGRTTAWGRRITDRTDRLVVDTTTLGVPSDRLTILLEHYRDDHAAGPELGDQRGLEAFQAAAYPEVQRLK